MARSKNLSGNIFIPSMQSMLYKPVSNISLSLCAAAPPPAAYGAIPSPHPRTQEEDARKLKAALPDGSKLVCLVAFPPATMAYYQYTTDLPDIPDITDFFPKIFSLASAPPPQNAEIRTCALLPAAR